MTGVAPLYDWLSRYVQLANWRAYGDRYAGLTMHKPLAVGGTSAVNDRLFAAAALARGARLLDAGCGFGGTIFAFHERLGGPCDGLTLSRVQQRVATREARRRGIANDCRFFLRSFDAPIAVRYDAIVAIETLVHSPDFARSLSNLAGALGPRGALLIVEDIPSDAIDGMHDAELLARHWSCPHLPTEHGCRSLPLAPCWLPISAGWPSSVYMRSGNCGTGCSSLGVKRRRRRRSGRGAHASTSNVHA